LNQDFEIVFGDQVAEEITVVNEIRSKDIKGKAAIDVVDLQVTYMNGAADPSPQVWTTHLLASPSAGARDKHWFLRATDQLRRVRVSGRVHYADGSYDDLKPTEYSTALIRIGTELLPFEF
jgi:hypothetical protein